MVPILMGAAPLVPHAVLTQEREILRREGYFHVGGIYYASSPDADKMRRLEAERRVRETERQRPPGEVPCAWCEKPIAQLEAAVIIAFRWVHETPCAKEFDEWMSGKPTAGSGGENDRRWNLVTDETPVDFEGEMTTWGELMVQDRKVCEMLADGRIVGGYPI